MADAVDLLEKERISKELIVNFNEWKEIIVLLNEILAWKKNWFPAIIFCSVTTIYLYVWLANCSMLNMVWTAGLLATVLDYFVCGPLKNALPLNSWDQGKELAYTAIAESVADFCATSKLAGRRFFALRRTNSKLFHSVLVVLFACLLYIGITFNNMFVSYLTVLVILSLPGLKARSEYIEENVQKYGQIIVPYVWTYIKKVHPIRK